MDAQVHAIHWHDKQPVYSLDFSPCENHLLATGGGDGNVRVWQAENGANPRRIHFLHTLTRHQGSVNCVRFSPCGEFLASAGDGGLLVIWGYEKDCWKYKKVLHAANIADIYDLAWSPDSKRILLGLVDNTSQIWNPWTRQLSEVFSEHNHFVNGVAWDPLGEFLATESNDRSVRIYSRKKRSKEGFGLCSIISKIRLERKDSVLGKYQDEAVISFFRRLGFSPDGALLATVCGVVRRERNENAVFFHTRGALTGEPDFFISGFEKPVVCVRFSPVLYMKQEVDSGFLLPYTLAFAVATLDTVYIGSTERNEVIGSVGGIHYTAITDLAWSSDGTLLSVSSTDGFVTSIDVSGVFGALYSEDKVSVVRKLLVQVQEGGASKKEGDEISPPPKESDTEEKVNTLAVIETLHTKDAI